MIDIVWEVWANVVYEGILNVKLAKVDKPVILRRAVLNLMRPNHWSYLSTRPFKQIKQIIN